MISAKFHVQVKPKTSKSIIFILLATILVVAVGGLLASPLFYETEVNEPLPVALDEIEAGLTELTIGFIPSEKADELTPKAVELEKYLEGQLSGIDIKVVVPTNYEIIIEGLRFGHIDAAFMDAGPAWIAHKRSGAEVVLAEVVNGKVNYQATVWTKADNDSIQTIGDTLGKRVAFTSITGSSGFVRPMGTLITQGHIDLVGDDLVALENALVDSFESYTFAGGFGAIKNNV